MRYSEGVHTSARELKGPEMTTHVEESHCVAIVAEYRGPTNHRGSRIIVRRGDHEQGRDKRLTVGWDHALDIGENYAAAIQQFAEMMGWDGLWMVGTTTSGAVGVVVSRGVRGLIDVETDDHRAVLVFDRPTNRDDALSMLRGMVS